MNISDIGVVTGLIMALGSAGATGGKFYLDTQYVPVSDFHHALNQAEIRQLKREIRQLERDPNRTELDEYYLEDLKDDLEELQNQ